jgi:trans-2,3-dihydro-3-hydroxyanthranilate isomerase
MRTYRYLHYDVFTSKPLAGNQLAVLPAATGLNDAEMQAIAKEMAFSETTFVLPAEAPGTDIRVRIFTPALEVPMAGHPTVGTAFALADEAVIATGRERLVFGLNVGPTPVDLEWKQGRAHFVWMTQSNPRFGPPVADRGAVAAALGLAVGDLVESLPVCEGSTGLPFLFVPLRDRDAVDRARTSAGALEALEAVVGENRPAYVFALEGGERPVTYSRMFGPQFQVPEDPATGSASGPLAVYLVKYGAISRAQAERVLNLQGYAIGRPSEVHISVPPGEGDIEQVLVGGQAVRVAAGELYL